MKTIVMLIGPPGSGKTTLANVMFPNHVRLSSDQFIEDRAKAIGLTYNAIFKYTADEAMRNLRKMRDDAIRFGHDIVWDQTNMTTSSRRKKLAVFPSDYTKIALVTDWHFDDLIFRNDARKATGRDVSVGIIKDMIAGFNQPQKYDGCGFDFILNHQNY